MYKLAMEETAAGAAWPGDEAPISILQCTFPPFDVKSVHPSVNLPRSWRTRDVQEAYLLHVTCSPGSSLYFNEQDSVTLEQIGYA
jgi:hypothetical protein